MGIFVFFSVLVGLASTSAAFIPHPSPIITNDQYKFNPTKLHSSSTTSKESVFSGFFKLFQLDNEGMFTKERIASKIVKELVVEEKCFTSEAGAEAFVAACADDVFYEDLFEVESPFKGKDEVLSHMLSKVRSRNGKGELRLDRISDGDKACGFVWTYTCKNEEGLRGTTFVELNNEQKISYIREIPEPLYKPGNLTVKLLEAITKGAEPTPDPVYDRRTPIAASEIAKYLFKEVNGDFDESMRFFDEKIFYRDFNFEEPLKGKDEVGSFIQDFTFPGITFVMDKCDDGIESTSFTWEVKIDGQDQAIKGISFYEVNTDTKKIEYVRDIPESAIKPPPLGNLARKLRPGLGVFNGVELGSRPGGK